MSAPVMTHSEQTYLVKRTHEVELEVPVRVFAPDEMGHYVVHRNISLEDVSAYCADEMRRGGRPQVRRGTSHRTCGCGHEWRVGNGDLEVAGPGGASYCVTYHQCPACDEWVEYYSDSFTMRTFNL